jgi:hypothetical protein
MKKLLVLIAISFSTTAYGQKDSSTSIYLGGALALSRYTVVEQNDVPVSPYYRTNSEFGIESIFDCRNNLTVKTGFYYTYYRSPFADNISTYDEFIQFPVLFSFLRHKINQDNRIVLLIGPQLSILSRHGIARTGDINYQIDNSSFGGFYKFGIVFEAGLMSNSNKILNSFGLKLQSDLPALTIKSNDKLLINDNFISLGIYYSFNKRISP